jgi:Na+/proline symporter
MAWFAIPFGFATTLGLAAVALTDNPAYPTYPNNMITSQISSGLSGPFATVALPGKPGSIALLLILFMAVTSSSSSELIAISSILTFDVYKMYIKPFRDPGAAYEGISRHDLCLWLHHGGFRLYLECYWN